MATGARVYHDTTVGYGNASWLSISFNSEHHDDGGLHSTVTDTHKLTIPTAGWYVITGHIKWAANATGVRGIRIMNNAATILASLLVDAVQGGVSGTNLSIGTAVKLSANDYLELQVYQNSGGTLNITAAQWESPEFAALFVAA